MRLVECVPNFSEGRDRGIIDAIAAAIDDVEGATVLDVDPGAGANRTVVTFVARPEAAVEAGFRAIRTASERIDMRRHKGEHPRLGATDVFPFVPVSGVKMAECVALARALGQRVAAELGIPVDLYEHAATRPERRRLADVRAGEYEGLAAKLADPAWTPDFGAAEFNDRAGATVIGARKFLAAYNVNLDTPDRRAAARLAKRVRDSGRPIRAIGWTIPEYGQAQVSMNLVDLEEAGLHDAFDLVVRFAGEAGLRVTGSELVGLIPERALVEAGRHVLRRQGRSPAAPADEAIRVAVRTLGLRDVGPFEPDERILERRLRPADRLGGLTVEALVGRFGAASATPGGGSAAALAAACSASLAGMVAGITHEKKGTASELQAELAAVGTAAQDVARSATAGIDEDSAAYEGVVAAMKLPKGTPEEIARRRTAIGAAARRAAEVPFELLRSVAGTMDGLETLARRGNPSCASDLLAAATLAAAAAETAHANVLANLPLVADARWTRRAREKADALRQDVVRRAGSVAARLRRALASPGAPAKRKARR
ncbi:MAG: glutamate formimidoyltransferase [Deltaproteobacteria bacterium]|nr:glutamate formimidoyltransferase [Deltaproteobacteria bacterium]